MFPLVLQKLFWSWHQDATGISTSTLNIICKNKSCKQMQMNVVLDGKQIHDHALCKRSWPKQIQVTAWAQKMHHQLKRKRTLCNAVSFEKFKHVQRGSKLKPGLSVTDRPRHPWSRLARVSTFGSNSGKRPKKNKQTNYRTRHKQKDTVNEIWEIPQKKPEKKEKQKHNNTILNPYLQFISVVSITT